ncbi:MAG: hypothetical protein V7640_499, partial [Betaproteobacteria bacterium]
DAVVMLAGIELPLEHAHIALVARVHRIAGTQRPHLLEQQRRK